jgi:2-amino-4-hydroxy-6-hydroxymethyldihydropteridine diphosphokinase
VENGDVFVALGSNLGDSASTLLKAWSLLGDNDDITITALSPPFLSAPVDMISHHWFINAVGRLATRLKPHALLDILLETESVFGRARGTGSTRGYRDRTLDLDLLYFGSEILDDPKLTLPHPQRAERLFVLAPMAAISPEFVDPGHSQTIAEMHLHLLEKMKNKQTLNQEITASSWPA